MKIATRVGLTLATAALMTVGLLANPASAMDTSWGGCCSIVKPGGGR